MKAKLKQIVPIGGGIWEVRVDGILIKSCRSEKEARAACDSIAMEEPCNCLPIQPDSVTVEFPGRGRQKMERVGKPDGTTVWVPGPTNNDIPRGKPEGTDYPVRSSSHPLYKYPTNDPKAKARKPKTCRECRYCSEPFRGTYLGQSAVYDVADCFYGRSGPRRIKADRIACHVGELRDEPWPEGEGE